MDGGLSDHAASGAILPISKKPVRCCLRFPVCGQVARRLPFHAAKEADKR